MAETRARDFANSEYPLVHTHKNIIIGGDFTKNPWQRGTSFTSVSTNAYTADRFKLNYAGVTGVIDIDRTGGDSPDGGYNSFRIDVTTADAALNTTDYMGINYNAEGRNIGHLGFGTSWGRTVTLSFWHKHTKTGTYSVAFRNGDATRCYVAEYTQAVTDTWEKAEITVPACPDGTWDRATTALGLQIWFSVAGGSTYEATAGSWVTSNALHSPNQVNALDSVSNFMRFNLIQLEVGEVATEFENRDITTELTLCQRYFQILDNVLYGLRTLATGTDTRRRATVSLITEMRANPTLTTLTMGAGTNDGTGASTRVLSLYFSSSAASTEAYATLAELDAEL